MALGLNKIILANATTNTPGAYFQFANITATTSSANLTVNVIPAGTYLFPGTANVTINVATAVSNANVITAVSPLYAANTGGVVISDGVSVFANASGSNVTFQVLTVDGGQPVSGTYNAS
jgi:hypothetical protein